jgi:hypothetical protein
VVGLYWFPGRAGVQGNEIADELKRFLDLSWPWESLGRIYEEGLDIGWLTSIGYGGEVLVTPIDRLES